MTTLDKVEEIRYIFKIVYENNSYLLGKIKELEQDFINKLPVNYEEI